jgi:hypothetical protein
VDAARGRHGGGERAVIQACRLLTAFAAFFTLTLSARAQDALTGAAVLERCTSAEASNVNWCVGFVYGVGAVVADGSIEGRLRACPPPDFTAETARLLVVSTLEKTDALRDLPGAYAVWYAFRKEFPCR